MVRPWLITGSAHRTRCWPEEDEAGGLHWKIRALVEAAAGQPFAWVDDEITDVDRASVSTHHAGRALLHHVDSEIGLTAADFVVLGEWAAWIDHP